MENSVAFRLQLSHVFIDNCGANTKIKFPLLVWQLLYNMFVYSLVLVIFGEIDCFRCCIGDTRSNIFRWSIFHFTEVLVKLLLAEVARSYSFWCLFCLHFWRCYIFLLAVRRWWGDDHLMFLSHGNFWRCWEWMNNWINIFI